MTSIEHVLTESVLESSRGRFWPGFEVMRAHLPGGMLEVDGLQTHTIAVNVGHAFRLDARIDGRSSSSEMHAGAIKLVEAGPRSRWQWDERSPIEMLHVSFGDDVLRACAVDLDLPAPAILTRVAFADTTLERLVRLLGDDVRDRPAPSLFGDAVRAELVLHVLANYTSLAGRDVVQPPRRRLGRRTLRLLDDYIEAHLGHDIAIADLAALAGVSRFHFARLFRATVGVPPHRYVLGRRLERARALLQSNQRSLREIAALTGCADQSHLTRAVKRKFGATPGALRGS